MIVIIASVISIDSRIFAQYLLSEPVFVIPILCLLTGQNINVFIPFIVVFQILSVFSIQLGKYSPPEYQAGAIIAFLLVTFSGFGLTQAILIGIVFSFIFNQIYKLKMDFNKWLVSISKSIHLSHLISIALSICIYFSIYLLAIHSGNFLSSFFLKHDNHYIFILILPMLKLRSIRVEGKSILFVMGLILMSVLILWKM
ncbi:hypothetical protein KAU15_05825 [candidate division WOR-3 bacterium]|nr:hypothetical protein [candidate division WOR-3 bacterium]